MKRIIRWLADVSGVTKDIETETTKFIGNEMHDAGYWLSAYPTLMLCIQLYAENLKKGNQHFFAFQFGEWRAKILEVNNK